MNIFRLDNDPVVAAQMQCDKHIVKMPTESAQMLSTVHRFLDGKLEIRKSKTGRRQQYYNHELDDVLYKTVHLNHPSTVWTRESIENYNWHYYHFIALCNEYKHRYGKIHATFTKLGKVLRNPPKNIPKTPETLLRLAMKANPECHFPNDPVKSYRLFYQTKQDRFKMVWTKRNQPEWFNKENK